MADRVSGPAVLAADLRPLTTSQLIDRGFTLYRHNFAGLFLLSLLSQIAPLATTQALLTTIKIMPTQAGLMERPITDPQRAAVVSALWIVSQIINFSFGVVMTTYLSDAYLGRESSIKKSFASFKGLLGASVLTTLLNMVLMSLTLIFPSTALVALFFWLKQYPPTDFGPLILFMVCALLLAAASLAPTLIVFMRLMLTIPAVALEHLSGWVAAKRSSVLVRYDPGLGFLNWGEMRLSFLLLPLFVIEVLALAFASLPSLLHEINEALMHGSIGQVTMPSETATIVSEVLVLLSGSLLLPLYLIATTLFYFDVRIRREGFDLEHLAEQVKAAS